MASRQIKIDEGLHEKVKEFVNNSERFSSYKSFYEDAVREKLDKEKGFNSDMEEKIDKYIEEKLG